MGTPCGPRITRLSRSSLPKATTQNTQEADLVTPDRVLPVLETKGAREARQKVKASKYQKTKAYNL